MLNRRHFLITGTSSLAAMAAVPNAIANPVGSLIEHTPSLRLKSALAQYEEKLGDSFIFRNENGLVRARLATVEQGPVATGLEQFTLVFDSTQKMDSDLYKATHLKSLNTSLMRIEPSYINSAHYLATFSLLT